MNLKQGATMDAGRSKLLIRQQIYRIPASLASQSDVPEEGVAAYTLATNQQRPGHVGDASAEHQRVGVFRFKPRPYPGELRLYASLSLGAPVELC